jgi:hypothetical protein
MQLSDIARYYNKAFSLFVISAGALGLFDDRGMSFYEGVGFKS